MKLEYKELCVRDLTPEVFACFERHQVVTRVWRKREDCWVIEACPFVEEWGAEDLNTLCDSLRITLENGGTVFSALQYGHVLGFAALARRPLGERGEYVELENLHVSAGLRGQGVGRALFKQVAQRARAWGAKKLYISAHSSVESQAFYHAVGCTEAVWYSATHAAKEPCDVQMEYVL